jgi:hypothetical protein
MWHRDFNKASLVGNQLYTYKDLFVAGYQIGPKYDRTFSRIFRKENVMIANETLELAVTVKSNNTLQNNEGVLCAGFGTKRYTYFIIIISDFILFISFFLFSNYDRQDFLYGSFRTFMRITPTAGTVAGMFMYHPEGEIDIELLSYLKPSQSYFAIHPGITENGRASNRTHKKHKLEFDASQVQGKKKERMERKKKN